MELEGKVCIVTGGASGIGLAIAKLYMQHGARVVIADIDDASLKRASETTGATAVRCNVAVSADVQRMVEQVVDSFGNIDVLVNNAGFGFTGTVVTIAEDDWDRLMSVNVKSMFLCSKYVIPVMAKNGGGAIINTTSYTAVSAIANRAAYVASKGAVSALTRAMALDHVKDGIRVNAVAPGTVDSPYFARIFAEAESPSELRAAFDARAALNRMGQPEEIAEAFLFLASDRSKFATGSILTVDGGSSIGNHLVA